VWHQHQMRCMYAQLLFSNCDQVVQTEAWFMSETFVSNNDNESDTGERETSALLDKWTTK